MSKLLRVEQINLSVFRGLMWASLFLVAIMALKAIDVFFAGQSVWNLFVRWSEKPFLAMLIPFLRVYDCGEFHPSGIA